MSTDGMAASPGTTNLSHGFVLAVLRDRAGRLLDVLVGVWIFAGGFVFIEPSPYEFIFIPVLLVAAAAGMGLYRSTVGILGILVAFTPFALTAAFQVRTTPLQDAMIFAIVTVFLLLTSYFVANYVVERTAQRMRIIVAAYTAVAVISALIGTLAYLGIMPGAEQFVRYGRAKAAFKDPNVYGPFLVLPAMFALQRMLLCRGWRLWLAAAIYVVIFVGIFVSFSRAAWGHFAFSSLGVIALCFLLEARAQEKVRIIIMAILGAGAIAVALVGLLSIPSVESLFEQRATGQQYDAGESGRFGRQGYAWELAFEHPLGVGSGEFSSRSRIVEEPHNVYVNVMHVYGWGGGALYYIFVAATLWLGLRALARPSPYRVIMIPLMATFVAVVGESAIIDSDHWRHYYLVAGLIWGIAAAVRHNPQRPGRRDRAII